MTISERVLAYLRTQPGTPNEIGEALGLTGRRDGYLWGGWIFAKAEKEGLIEWREEKWHLKEAEGVE